MDKTSLEDALSDQPCPSCGIARQRPTLVQQVQREGDFVFVDCRNPRCGWRARAELPRIRKTLVYLDSSAVSNMAKALHREDPKSEWSTLYQTLRAAASSEVVSCPASSIVEDEAVLSRYGKEIVQLSKEFADSGLDFRTRVEEAQLFRAFRRHRAGETAELERAPPEADAFESSPHRWQERFRIDVNLGKPGGWTDRLRTTKGRVHDGVVAAYEEYRQRGLNFEQIRQLELGGYGKAILEIGMNSLAAKTSFVANPASYAGDSLQLFDMSVFEKLSHVIEHEDECGMLQSFVAAQEFLLGPHLKMTPVADINATLHAAIAWAMQGESQRRPSPSDSADIGHLSVYLPYFDAFVADRFFANACDQRGLSEKYGTRVFRTGDIAGLIDFVQERVDQAPHRALVERLHESIQKGGYAEEEDRRLQEFLKARGWDEETAGD